MTEYFLGVDVGTASVRAALVSSSGECVHLPDVSVQPVTIWNEEQNHYEQSSRDIWQACCSAVKGTLSSSGISSFQIKGIGFTGTCSLVAVDGSGEPITVSPSNDDNRNIIMWMDHRAMKEAETINSSKHDVLKYVGGVISPEMQAPKLLWLKMNLRQCWDRAVHFFDLPDFMTFKATGKTTRSLCSVICKWNYVCDGSKRHATTAGWDSSYWSQIGLEEFLSENFQKIGTSFSQPGDLIGGLTEQAASDLGLMVGTPVGASIIDAHAGGVGMLGANVDGTELPCEGKAITTRLALICGTSSCHMALSSQPCFVPGVWGPYFSAMVPGLWLNEGGQSATGRLLRHIINCHPASSLVKERARIRGVSVFDELNTIIKNLAAHRQLDSYALLTRDLHVLPDYHGNRSPLADPNMKGMILGLTLASDVDDLACLYLATIQGIAHGTRHVLDSMVAQGHDVNTIFACGGGSRNDMFVQIHADITGLPIVVCKEQESVLVGAAMLGACSSSHFPSFQTAMSRMSSVGKVTNPDTNLTKYYTKRHEVFLKMISDQLHYRQTMKST
ncbi:FGGY carbohydrate kinase domain-containing protein-like [Corticium candelabrum]|uniref:FGGY carbohydrate kinase domain-containing protein-like n=1 Tax=Corticium candelabrum TaxID=121492 RepID=UPI002E2532C2|nr:FGGY carbohydrate kinase domain-containing protein-like [Corticium candelabrum]